VSRDRTHAIVSLSFALIFIGVVGVGIAAVQIYQTRSSVGSQVLPTLEPLVTTPSPQPTTAAPRAITYSPYPKEGDVIGTISIPILKEQLPIIEGTGDAELKRGVGHFIRSVLPGIQDNSVLAGHRDSVFSQLGKLSMGDLLVVRTAAGQFTYKVAKFRIVKADDRTVIVPTPSAILTLSTCYPFRYIGNAPERFIVTASLVESVTS
jgi:sortase A